MVSFRQTRLSQELALKKKGQDPPLENAEGFARVTGYKELDKSLAFASVQRLQMNYLPEMQKLYSSMFSFYP